MAKKQINKQKLFQVTIKCFSEEIDGDMIVSSDDSLIVWIIAKNIQEVIKRVENEFRTYEILNINYIASSIKSEEEQEILLV